MTEALPIVAKLRSTRRPNNTGGFVNPNGSEAAALITELVKALADCAHWVEWCIHNHDAPDSSLEEGALAQADAALARAGVRRHE